MIFTETEREYLQAQSLGRLATVQPDGSPQVNPVGFTYNVELEAIDIAGFTMGTTQKRRDGGLSGLACGLGSDLEVIEQVGRSRGDSFDCSIEGLDIGLGRFAHTADLADVLQGGRGHLLLGGRLDVRRAQRFDAPAHATKGSP